MSVCVCAIIPDFKWGLRSGRILINLSKSGDADAILAWCVFVCHKSGVGTVERIELVCGIEASFKLPSVL